MAKTKIWYTRDGRDVQVRQMSTEHLERCIARIMHTFRVTRHGDVVRWRGQYFRPLVVELERRRAEAKTAFWNAALDHVINPHG